MGVLNDAVSEFSRLSEDSNPYVSAIAEGVLAATPEYIARAVAFSHARPLHFIPWLIRDEPHDPLPYDVRSRGQITVVLQNYTHEQALPLGELGNQLSEWAKKPAAVPAPVGLREEFLTGPAGAAVVSVLAGLKQAMGSRSPDDFAVAESWACEVARFLSEFRSKVLSEAADFQPSTATELRYLLSGSYMRDVLEGSPDYSRVSTVHPEPGSPTLLVNDARYRPERLSDVMGVYSSVRAARALVSHVRDFPEITPEEVRSAVDTVDIAIHDMGVMAHRCRRVCQSAAKDHFGPWRI